LLAIALRPVPAAPQEAAPTSAPTPPAAGKPPAISTLRVPILVYHHIRQPAANGSRGLKRLTVTPEAFDQQMKYLQENGYHVVTFAALFDAAEHGGELPAHPAVITFDDGWEDQYSNALPTLEKYHYPATFFIVTNYIGYRSFLSWRQLQVLLDKGMTIGSHSRSHPRLSRITDPEILWHEIAGSRQALEANLEASVNDFAYPYGSYNDETQAMVGWAGYKTARACCSGVAAPLNGIYALKAIMAPNDMALFAKYLGMPAVAKPRGQNGRSPLS
jgi:peptidoglycan/xylan/chitin deacetylase (PgdA/CDA1 family)